VAVAEPMPASVKSQGRHEDQIQLLKTDRPTGCRDRFPDPEGPRGELRLGIPQLRELKGLALNHRDDHPLADVQHLRNQLLRPNLVGERDVTEHRLRPPKDHQATEVTTNGVTLSTTVLLLLCGELMEQRLS
jgi:hypothetical protein